MTGTDSEPMPALEGSRWQLTRLGHEQALGDGDQFVLVHPVDEHPGLKRDQHDGERPGRGDKAHVKRVAREFERQPSQRHLLHPRAGQRHRLPDPENPEVPVSDEDAERVQ